MKDHNAKRVLGALALLLFSSVFSLAHSTHTESWARDKFASAQQLRDSLAARPKNERTRHDYQRVIDAYRRVYLGCPTCTRADPSVVATAELLLELGREYKDINVLGSAIKQYQFLRREYPGSKARVEALFTIGAIYKDDLDEASAARATFRDFLQRYPNSALAQKATAALAELNQSSVKGAHKTNANPPSVDEQEEGSPEEASKPVRYTRVTGILHWSNPDFARVAIDLEEEVQFKSERLNHPSRIYFDLRDTRLAAGLAGKSFDVPNGPLKKIRVAQFERGRSRVVLEIDPQSDYKAFLAANPSRLMVEIRCTAADKSTSLQGPTVSPWHPATPAPTAASIERATLPPSDSTAALGNKPQIAAAHLEENAPAAKPIPRRIVEADDDDQDYTEATPPKAKTATRTTSTHGKSNAVPSSGMATQRKRKSADGNDDEIATLTSPDSPSAGPRSLAASPLVNIPVTVKGEKNRRSHAKQDSTIVDMREAQPTMAGDRSLIRALGLKIGRIVIDPGHGGHDTGTIGPNGVEEKNIVLDVSKRLGKLLQARMGADVVFTREDDTFIPLETRTAIANDQGADLFVSIHANSSRDEDARGVETYYLNFTSNAAALEVASRENAASDKSIHELQDLVKKIALKEKIEESREFAMDVQRSLHSGLAVKNPGIRDRGVKKAPFVVLIGANMPSILAEISFVSNPTDERKLDTPEYRERIADSLYKGIAKYVNGLSGVKVASRMPRSDGQ